MWGTMQQQTLGIVKEHSINIAQRRVSALDVVRGLIMSFMALSHCQEYISLPKNQPHDWDEHSQWFSTSFFEFFQHAFISMMASGGFFMMMGIGIVFLWHAREKEGWTHEKIAHYLIKRGSLLILLQFTMLQLFEIVASAKIHIYVGVLFALGSCMILAACFLYAFRDRRLNIKHISLPAQYIAIPLIIIAILTTGDFIIDTIRTTGMEPSPWLMSLFLGGTFNLSGIKIDINFTPIPWFPAVAFGLFLGDLLVTRKEKAWRYIRCIALSSLVAWLTLRFVEPWIGFGEYKLLADRQILGISSLLAMSKYPPSLSYFLYALGLNLLLLLAFRRWQFLWPYMGNILEPLQVFGRSPLFFFVSHWFIYFAMSRMLPQKIEAVGGILLFWLLGLSVLYALCKSYYPWKMSKDKESIWRMF